MFEWQLDDGILEKLTFTLTLSVYYSRIYSTDKAKQPSNYLDLVNFCQTRIIMDTKMISLKIRSWAARIMLHAFELIHTHSVKVTLIKCNVNLIITSVKVTLS